MGVTMNAWDALSAGLAECYVTIDGRRYRFMQAINLEASIEKKKMHGPRQQGRGLERQRQGDVPLQQQPFSGAVISL